MHVLFHSLFCYGLSQDIEYSSLCYIVGPCCLCILYVIVYICRSQNLNPSLPQPFPPWQRCVDELNLRLGYGVAKEIRASPDGCGTAVGPESLGPLSSAQHWAKRYQSWPGARELSPLISMPESLQRGSSHTLVVTQHHSLRGGVNGLNCVPHPIPQKIHMLKS